MVKISWVEKQSSKKVLASAIKSSNLWMQIQSRREKMNGHIWIHQSLIKIITEGRYCDDFMLMISIKMIQVITKISRSWLVAYWKILISSKSLSMNFCNNSILLIPTNKRFLRANRLPTLLDFLPYPLSKDTPFVSGIYMAVV